MGRENGGLSIQVGLTREPDAEFARCSTLSNEVQASLNGAPLALTHPGGGTLSREADFQTCVPGSWFHGSVPDHALEASPQALVIEDESMTIVLHTRTLEEPRRFVDPVSARAGEPLRLSWTPESDDVHTHDMSLLYFDPSSDLEPEQYVPKFVDAQVNSGTGFVELELPTTDTPGAVAEGQDPLALYLRVTASGVPPIETCSGVSKCSVESELIDQEIRVELLP